MALSKNQLDSAFKGFTLSDNSFDYHLIVNDNPYMAEVGMTAFTTGQLYEWITKTNANSGLINMEIFGITEKRDKLSASLIKDVCNKILGGAEIEISKKIYFSSFRKDGNGGKYEKFENAENWTYGDFGWDSIEFGEFDDKLVEVSFTGTPPPTIPTTRPNPSGIDKQVANIIEINNWVRYQSMISPSSIWSEKSLARFDFIDDIKASKERCIQWSGIVPLTLNIGVETTEGSKSCTKEVWTNFKLFLFDEKNPLENSRKVSFNDFTIVAPKIDHFGRTGFKEDGKLNSSSRNIKPSDSVAASMDLTWNEFSGKWESGTPQILAIITTNIDAARIPSLNDIKNLPIDDLLDPSIQHESVIGSAIPLKMQNGNPLQISPEYRLDEANRQIKSEIEDVKEDVEKLTVTVYNRSPMAFKVGDIVILHRIDGVWQPTIFKETEAVEEKIIPEIENWDFTYLMANADVYFCNKQQQAITYTAFEQAIYGLYYKNDPLNAISSYNPESANVENNYFHITSFDFVGPTLGGLRTNGHAISNTNYYNQSDGTNNNPSDVPGETSSPFFGCTFPDGYDTLGKYDLYQNGNHQSISNRQTYVPPNYGISYTTNILPNIQLFSNAFNKNRHGSGMFYLNSSDLAHLPADIAVNSSPSGKYGQTIKPIFPFAFLSKNGDDGTTNGFMKKIDTKFFTEYQERRGEWLYYSGIYNSAFDFKPKNIGRLTFRPLKLETYATFEFDSWDGDQRPGHYVQWWPPLAGQTNADMKIFRGKYGARSWYSITDKESPISMLAKTRNSYCNYPFENQYKGDFDNTYNDIYGYRGLRYNIDIFKGNPRYPNDSAPKPDAYWLEGWMHGTQGGAYLAGSGDTNKFIKWIADRGFSNFRNWHDNTVLGRPAGAVGVIAAQCTAKAKDAINIQCDSLLGLKNELKGSFSLFGPTYTGVGNYQSYQTSNLNVRVFHAWPRNLTIYDPRFFAVFHFNPGAGIIDKPVSEQYYFNGSPSSDPPDVNNFNYPNGWYLVAIAESAVDVRIPTKYDGQPGVNGDYIYSSNFRKKEHSDLNTSRRGKMLPYKYQMITGGIDTNGVMKTWESLPEKGFYSPKETSLVLISPGQNYSVNDRFIVSGKNVLLKPIISNLTINNKIYTSGIIGFDVLDAGIGFFGEDFIDESAKMSGVFSIDTNKGVLYDISSNGKKPLNLKTKIVPSGTVSGKGFSGGFARGKVYTPEAIFIDEKPAEITFTRLDQITSPPSNGTAYDPSVTVQETSIDLTKNPNIKDIYGYDLKRKYDLFFHFHNDITHTPSMDVVKMPAKEQYATITISPL